MSRDVSSLYRRAERLAKRRGVTLATVSKWIFRDHRRLGDLATGESFARPPTLAKARARLEAIERGAPANDGGEMDRAA